MSYLSLTDTMFSLATSITSALIPSSDKILREASIVIINMIGLTPPPSQGMIECYQNNGNVQFQTSIQKKKPKIRKCIKIHRNNNATYVRGRSHFFFNTMSYTKFLEYHRSKWMSIKSKFTSKTNGTPMLTIPEEDL